MRRRPCARPGRAKPWHAGRARGLVVRGARGGLGNLMQSVVRQGDLGDEYHTG
jgi:hypothetical protein